MGIVFGIVKCYGDGIVILLGVFVVYVVDCYKDFVWRGGWGVGGGWMCEFNSDCIYFLLGEE